MDASSLVMILLVVVAVGLGLWAFLAVKGDD
jgi:hypothetical protein